MLIIRDTGRFRFRHVGTCRQPDPLQENQLSVTQRLHSFLLHQIRRFMGQFNRIRNMREDKDWSQLKVATMLKISRKVYSNYENGRTQVPSEILVELADIHGTSMDYLAGRTDSPYFEKITYIPGDKHHTVTSLSVSDQP